MQKFDLNDFCKIQCGFCFWKFLNNFFKIHNAFFSFLFGVFDGLGFGELGAFPLCLCVFSEGFVLKKMLLQERHAGWKWWCLSHLNSLIKKVFVHFLFKSLVPFLCVLGEEEEWKRPLLLLLLLLLMFCVFSFTRF